MIQTFTTLQFYPKPLLIKIGTHFFKLPIHIYYRVTRVAYLGQEQQLIRVKNCSGPLHINWVGAWNPKDTRWANVPESVKKELDAETHQDGGFWMAYGDFLKYFKVQLSTGNIC